MLTQDEAKLLSAMFDEINDDQLKGWDYSFIKDQRERYEEYGATLRLSPKQWSQIRRIHQNQTGGVSNENIR
jgi:hypothetical protein